MSGVKKENQHGMNKTPVYRVWATMKQRCQNVRNANFKDYGGRGITVCKEWQTFTNFFRDMGYPPFKGATLERKNNQEGYSPENCRWATYMDQGSNRRNNRCITIGSETHHLAEWCRLRHVPYNLVYGRLEHGWSLERALTQSISNSPISNNKLTPAQVVAIRRRRSEGETRKALSEEFEVHPTTISYATGGRTWKHV
jgi:hypothetical protein